MSQRFPLRLLVADESNLIRSIFSALPDTEVKVAQLHRTKREMLSALDGRPQLDAVLCDLHLSGNMGGVDALTQLRGRDLLRPETAFLLMSEDNRMSTMMSGAYSKPDAILLKPFKVSTLMDKLELTVHNRRQLSELILLAKDADWITLLRQVNHRIVQGPVSDQVNKFKAQALSGLQANDLLVQFYADLLKENPSALWVHENWAKLEYTSGRLAEASQRLTALVARFPANIQAHRMLAAIQQDFGNFKGVQAHLEAAMQHASHDTDLQRDLGYAALLNGDLLCAHRSFQSVVRLSIEAGSLSVIDAINAIRVLLLQDESEQAYKHMVDYKTLNKQSVALIVMDYFIRASFYRKTASPGMHQRQVRDGLQVLDESTGEAGVIGRLAAVESCLMARLSREALARSYALVAETKSNELVPAVVRLRAVQLNTWAQQMADDALPHGFLHYRQAIK